MTCLLVSAAMLWLLPAGARAAIPSGNLLLNGDAEVDAANCGQSSSAGVAPTDWTVTRSFTVICYSTALTLDPSTASAIGGGTAYFMGGVDASTSASQTVDISGASSEVDLGGVQATLSGDLGGYSTQNDAMAVSAVFYDAGQQAVGGLAIGPVLAADRNNQSTLVPRTQTMAVPPGTRTIVVTMTAGRAEGSDNDAAADNLSLTLVAPSVPGELSPPTVPSTVGQSVVEQADPGSWSGSPTSYEYQWIRCDADGNTNCADISGATGQSFTPTGDDVGHTLRVRVTAVNAGGRSSAVTSAASGLVTAEQAPVLSKVAIGQTGPGQLSITGHLATGGVSTAYFPQTFDSSNGLSYALSGIGGTTASDGDFTLVLDHDAFSPGGAPNLQPGTTYQFTVRATAEELLHPGYATSLYTDSPLLSFRLSGAPAVTAGSSPGCANGTVVGTIDAYGTATTYHFVVTQPNGAQTVTADASAGSSWTPVSVGLPVQLATDQDHANVSIVAHNRWGTTTQTTTYTRGLDCLPVATPASDITTTSATLNGTAFARWSGFMFLSAPGGVFKTPSTPYWTGYGSVSDPAGTGGQMSSVAAGAGVPDDCGQHLTAEGPQKATISNLTPGVTYAYVVQLNVVDWAGTCSAPPAGTPWPVNELTYSNVEYFRTASTSTPSSFSVTTSLAHVAVGCFSGGGCTGKVQLTSTSLGSLPVSSYGARTGMAARKKPRVIVLGAAAYRLAAHQHRAVRLTFSKRGRALLRRHALIHALLILTETEHGVRTRTSHAVKLRVRR